MHAWYSTIGSAGPEFREAAGRLLLHSTCTLPLLLASRCWSSSLRTDCTTNACVGVACGRVCLIFISVCVSVRSVRTRIDPRSFQFSLRSIHAVSRTALHLHGNVWCAALPESKALPSVAIFAECLLSGTRQRRLCRVPHSVKLDSRQRGSLPSAGHSAQDDTRQRLVCRVSNTRQRGSRQRAVNGRPKADGRQPLPRASGWHSAKRILCRVSHI
jgi:hypothetical protein